jgi:hypothetical protein
VHQAVADVQAQLNVIEELQGRIRRSRVTPAPVAQSAEVSLGDGANPFRLAFVEGALWVVGGDADGNPFLWQVDTARNVLVGPPTALDVSPILFAAGGPTLWIADPVHSSVTRIDLVRNG